MFDSVSLPVWLLLVLVLLATWAVVDRLLTPGVRWFLRRRGERALDELNSRLRIRVQPFKLTKRQVLIDRLMFDSEVLETAEARCRETGRPRKLVMGEVETYAREIVPAFNAYIYFRLGFWLARRVSRTLYRVRLGSIDQGSLAAIPENAAVVFVMNHRSNMDYILVSYLAAEESALSYAVGEWARIWPLEQLIRAMGAYFVRRRSRNALYRKVLERYVQMAIEQGVTQAVFPEGRLSRDGGLQPAKLGLLDYMLRGFDPTGERDVVFVPVAINYDRVLEDRTLLLDLEPGPRAPDGPGAVATAMRFACRQLGLMARQKWHRFGYACVSFGAPVSARSYLAGRNVDLRELNREERFRHVDELASVLMAEIGRIVPLLPVALVSTVLERRLGQSLSELELKSEVQQLMADLESARFDLYLPRRDREYAIEVGLRMLILRRVVDRDEDGLLIARPGESGLLRYYANSIAQQVSVIDGSSDAERRIPQSLRP
jgi:glycerol-3-phosphate O-acyltransferase